MHIFKANQEILKKNARELAEKNRSIKNAGERLKVVYRLFGGGNVLESTHMGLSRRSVWKQEV